MYLKIKYGHSDESTLKLGLHDRQIYINIRYIFENPISVTQKYIPWQLLAKVVDPNHPMNFLIFRHFLWVVEFQHVF